MTEERKVREADGHEDSRVSRSYREIASERAPASLNEAILREARSRGGRGYAHAISWLRPLAWAATVGLSLAIVIELSQTPDLTPPANGLSSPAAPAAALGGETQDELDKRRRDAEQRIASKLEAESSFEEVAAAPVEAPAGMQSTPAEPAADDASLPEAIVALESEYREDDYALNQPAEPSERLEAAAVALADDAEPASAEPSLPEPDAAFAVSSLRSAPTAARARLQETAADGCDETERRTPESWHACIEALAELGDDSLVDAERRALAEAFPDFRPPED